MKPSGALGMFFPVFVSKTNSLTLPQRKPVYGSMLQRMKPSAAAGTGARDRRMIIAAKIRVVFMGTSVPRAGVFVKKPGDKPAGKGRESPGRLPLEGKKMYI